MSDIYPHDCSSQWTGTCEECWQSFVQVHRLWFSHECLSPELAGCTLQCFTHGALSQNVNVVIPRSLPGYIWHKNIEDICGIGEE